MGPGTGKRKLRPLKRNTRKVCIGVFERELGTGEEGIKKGVKGVRGRKDA